MSGDDFHLTDKIILHHPNVSEMLYINNGYLCEELYWDYIQSILCDPYSNMVMLDDMGKNFLEVTPFEIFVMQWNNNIQQYEQNKEMYDKLNAHPLNIVLSALELFVVGEHNFVLSSYEDGEPCLVDKNDTTYQINEKIFNCLCEWLKAIHKIDYSNRIKPADENARKILVDDMRDEIKKAKRRNKDSHKDAVEYIGGLMSAVCFGGNGAINPFNIKQAKMYWLFESFGIDSKKLNASRILDGIYHGTINYKDINKKELDWMN